MKNKLAPYLLLAPQILLAILFVAGLIAGITQSFGVIPAFGLTEPTLRYYREIFLRPDLMESVLFSLKTAGPSVEKRHCGPHLIQVRVDRKPAAVSRPDL